MLLKYRLCNFFFHIQQVETTENSIQLKKLETGKLYKVFVVSKNLHGTSLPSSILLLNITSTGNISRTRSFGNVHNLLKHADSIRSRQ